MSTATYRVNFEDVKRAVHMDQVIDFLVLTGLKQRSAGQWKGTCPFCKGQDCFVVSQAGGRDKTGAFNCFKCPAGGDQIELVSMMRGNPQRRSHRWRARHSGCRIRCHRKTAGLLAPRPASG